MAWPPRCMPGYLPARARACERRCKSWEEASDRSRPAGNTIETSMHLVGAERSAKESWPRRRARARGGFGSLVPFFMPSSSTAGCDRGQQVARLAGTSQNGFWEPIIECMRAARVPFVAVQWFTHWTTVSFVPGRGQHALGCSSYLDAPRSVTDMKDRYLTLRHKFTVYISRSINISTWYH